MNLRRTTEYKNMVYNVLQRDRCCQVSGHSICDMTTIFVVPFASLVKDWREADDLYKEHYYKRIFNEDNVIAITEELKEEFYELHWKRYYTKEMFDEWRESKEYISSRDLNITEEVVELDWCRPLTIISVGS